MITLHSFPSWRINRRLAEYGVLSAALSAYDTSQIYHLLTAGLERYTFFKVYLNGVGIGYANFKMG